MYNIDFTGGTLVTIRLERGRPGRQDADRVAACGVRPREGRASCPTSRSRACKVGNDKTLTRFNIRTTDDKPDHVKTGILDAFGPSLDAGRDDLRRRPGRSRAAPPAATAGPRPPIASPAAGSTT